MTGRMHKISKLNGPKPVLNTPATKLDTTQANKIQICNSPSSQNYLLWLHLQNRLTHQISSFLYVHFTSLKLQPPLEDLQSTALFSSQSCPILEENPWLPLSGPFAPCIKRPQGLGFSVYWSKSLILEPCLFLGFNYLNTSLLLPWNEDDVISLKLFLPQFEDVAGSVSFSTKLYLPQYEDITLWCTGYFDFIKRGFVASGFVAAGSPNVKTLPTDSVNGMWFKALKSGEAHDSQVSSILLSAGSSLAKEAIRMLEALQLAKTHKFSSLQLILDSIVVFSVMRSWLDMIKITCLLFRNLVTLFTPLSCSFNQCTTTWWILTRKYSPIHKYF
ncbi:hypothetical protein HID58_025246 [Brassica napus]|uniref:RNase H type-1 domain-containing protein n=1 Tax=Brassica napus TaxID=3708 RepID=A0ABQ8CMM3_BRANA|nr:hypothetical protein HID58_025246 [Brassica napus]